MKNSFTSTGTSDAILRLTRWIFPAILACSMAIGCGPQPPQGGQPPAGPLGSQGPQGTPPRTARDADAARPTSAFCLAKRPARPMARHPSDRYGDHYDCGDRSIPAGGHDDYGRADNAKWPLPTHRTQYHPLYGHRMVAQEQDHARPVRYPGRSHLQCKAVDELSEAARIYVRVYVQRAE